jgi:nicotinamide-nucleotide amidase
LDSSHFFYLGSGAIIMFASIGLTDWVFLTMTQEFIMKAELLATGDEIRTGTLVDSNSAYLAKHLERCGVSVVRHSSVGDNLDDLVAVIKEIGARADIAVVTGGLGPTVDDRSAEAAARAAGVKLVLDEQALANIEAFFNKLGRPFSESNRKQALIPHGAECLPNAVGTAPGFSLAIGRCTFFFLPGVPHEMKKMFSEQVLSMVDAMLGALRCYNLTRSLSTFGLPESVVGEKAAGVESAFPGVTLGLRAKFPEIQVKLYYQGRDQQAGIDLLESAAQWVSQQLGSHVFSVEGASMAAEVGKLLVSGKATLAVAESCTGGLVGNWLTNIPGSSDYFLLSAVTYDNQAKTNVLGVSSDTIIQYGAVHEQVAAQMAQGTRRVGGADYGLATTGIAGPSGGSPEKPVGTVCIAVASAEATVTRRHHFSFGRRLMNKRIFAMAALDTLRRVLLGLPMA